MSDLRSATLPLGWPAKLWSGFVRVCPGKVRLTFFGGRVDTRIASCQSFVPVMCLSRIAEGFGLLNLL